MKKKTVTLYFVNGPVPAADAFAEAEKLPGQVSFRNALFVGPEDKPEACDYVAGDVPPQYAQFPRHGDKHAVGNTSEEAAPAAAWKAN